MLNLVFIFLLYSDLHYSQLNCVFTVFFFLPFELFFSSAFHLLISFYISVMKVFFLKLISLYHPSFYDLSNYS